VLKWRGLNITGSKINNVVETILKNTSVAQQVV